MSLMPFVVLLAAPLSIVASGCDRKPSETKWIGTWSTSPQAFMPGSLETFRNQSIRLIVHTSAGGGQVRIRLSNAFGDGPLRIGSAHVARRTSGADIDPASDRALTFTGKSLATISAGSELLSDPVEMNVPAQSDLAITLFFPNETPATTSHFLALQTNYVSPATGDSNADAKFPIGKTIESWPFLTAVEVTSSARAFSIVVFGDSTVDGDGSTSDANRRWPDVLATKLQTGGKKEAGILNQGIIGNRLLNGSPQQAGSEFGNALGESGLIRFKRDALAQAGVKYVIVRIGINDIGFPGSFAPKLEQVSAEELIEAYRRLIAQARKSNLRIIGSTMSPFEDATPAPGYYTAEKEVLRQQVNAWIRDSGEFDAVIDCDLILRDPNHPSRLNRNYDSGDHLHPNDVGYAATVEAIPLSLFEIHGGGD
jgi:lysophospholipase L1-like esterase